MAFPFTIAFCVLLAIRRCFGVVRKRDVFLIGLAVFAFPMYSASVMIYQWLFDNEITVIKSRNVEDAFPYLRHDSLELCLLYTPHLFGEDGYQNELFDADYFTHNRNVSELGSRGDLLRTVQDLDDDAILCATIGGDAACSLSEAADGQIRRREFLSSLEDEIWPKIASGLIRRLPFVRVDNTSTEPEYSLLYFNRDRLCVNMNLSRVLRKNAEIGEYVFGPIGHNAAIGASSSNDDGSRRIRMTYRNTNGNRRPPVLSMTNKAYTLTIDPVVLIDYTTLGEKCSMEPKVFYRSRFDGSDEAKRYYLRFLATECGCLAYSYRRQFVRLDSYSPAFAQLPFCTADQYKRCLGNFSVALAKQRIARRCFIAKNTIAMTSTDLPSNSCFRDNNTDVCSNSRILFETYADEYTVFEEHLRYTWSNVISMIGGDIGVTIGWSIVTVYQRIRDWCVRRWHSRVATEAATTEQPGDGDDDQQQQQRLTIGRLVTRVSDLEAGMGNVNWHQATSRLRLNELTERVDLHDELLRVRAAAPPQQQQQRRLLLPPIDRRPTDTARARRREARANALQEASSSRRFEYDNEEDGEETAV